MAHPRLQPNVRAVERDTVHCGHLRVDEQAVTLDSDLSADLQILDEELAAIARFLGDDLRIFLSEA
jgi:hypothetical protein